MDETKEIPQSFSTKRLLLYSIDGLAKSFANLSPENDFALCLVTPAGMLIGNIKNEDDQKSTEDYFRIDKENGTLDVDLDLALVQTDPLFKEFHEKGTEIRKDGACFTLEKAVFLPGSNNANRLCFKQMVVFVDQVISAAIVPRSFANYEE